MNLCSAQDSLFIFNVKICNFHQFQKILSLSPFLFSRLFSPFRIPIIFVYMLDPLTFSYMSLNHSFINLSQPLYDEFSVVFLNLSSDSLISYSVISSLLFNTFIKSSVSLICFHFQKFYLVLLLNCFSFPSLCVYF